MHSSHPRGMILFLTLLILGVTAVTAIFLLSQSSVNGFLQVDEQTKAQQVRTELFGCLDEVYIHFAANPNFAPTTVNMGTYTCDATDQVNGSVHTVTLSHSAQGIVRRVTATINSSTTPITISSVREQ